MRLVPLKLPDKLPVRALTLILNVEAAAAFDELTRQGTTEGLNEWPRIFKQARFVPAVAYLQANRVRTLLVREMEKMLEPVDAYVGGDDLTITNLTGHPCVVLPNGLRERDGVKRPGSLTFTGRLYGETELVGDRPRLPTGDRSSPPYAADGEAARAVAAQGAGLVHSDNPQRDVLRITGR